MGRALILSAILLLGFSGATHAHTSPWSEQEKIAYLLDAIGTSNATFIRNGVEYPATVAKAHLEDKLETAGDTIQTADDFIEKIGSRSSITGKPYYIQFPDGSRMESGTWLHEILIQ